MKNFMAFCALLIHSESISSQMDTSRVVPHIIEEAFYSNTQDTITVYRNFEARLDMLSKEEGGRQTAFFNNFQPSFKIGKIKVFGAVILPRSIQMIRPGDKKKVSINLKSSVELKEGQQFEIFELEKKIGSGTVLKLIK